MSSQLGVRIAGYRNYITYAGRKLNNKLCMAGYRKYVSYRYVFISSFVSLTKYEGQNMNTLMWLRMAGEFVSMYLLGYALSSQLWLRMAVYRNYFSLTYVFISSFVSVTKYAGRKLNTLMWLCMVGEFMSTYYLCTNIWLMSHLLTVDNRPGFQLNVDTYAFVYLLRTNQYTSNQYILD